MFSWNYSQILDLENDNLIFFQYPEKLDDSFEKVN